MRHLAALCACLLALSAPLRAQEAWPNLDALLGNTLAPGARFERAFWLPDNPQAHLATQAIGVVYPIIEGAAGNTGITVGHFQRVEGGWAFAGIIGDLYGFDPRDVAFAPGAVSLTTTMLGPGEPRCCPTMAVRWRIDLTTRSAQRLN